VFGEDVGPFLELFLYLFAEALLHLHPFLDQCHLFALVVADLVLTVCRVLAFELLAFLALLVAHSW
jgi:hypothetical protein